MILGAAFCPHPPVLVPQAASGTTDELDELRAACRVAISAACAGRLPVLLGAGPVSRIHSPQARGSLAAFGVPGEIALRAGADGADTAAPVELPLSLTVGAWLVCDALGPASGARAFSVGPDFATSRAAAACGELVAGSDVALVVLADGSARRSTSAPGYLDERASGFDAAVAAALAGGDGAELQRLDDQLGTELLAGGLPAWHAAGALLAGRRFQARVDYDAAPFGVGYFVATWLDTGDVE